MKTSTKVIIGLIAVLIAIGWYTSVLYEKANENRSSSPIEKAAKDQVQTEAKKIAEEVGKNGLNHTILKIVKEIDQSAVDKVSADLLDTVAALGIARDKLRQVTVYATSLSIKNQELERKITTTGQSLSWKDSNFNILVDVPSDTLKKATANLGYDADLITTQYNKYKFPLGNSTYLDIYSNDKRFTIKGARTLTVKQAPPFFKGDLQAVTEYNFRSKSFSAGPSIGVTLGRVELRGKYLFDPSSNEWGWIASGGYRLLGL